MTSHYGCSDVSILPSDIVHNIHTQDLPDNSSKPTNAQFKVKAHFAIGLSYWNPGGFIYITHSVNSLCTDLFGIRLGVILIVQQCSMRRIYDMYSLLLRAQWHCPHHLDGETVVVLRSLTKNILQGVLNKLVLFYDLYWTNLPILQGVLNNVVPFYRMHWTS